MYIYKYMYIHTHSLGRREAERRYPTSKVRSNGYTLLEQPWKRWESQTTWPASWETYMQVRKQQLELDMEQQTASK